MATSIINILRKGGPTLSSVIVKKLVEDGFTPQAARKRVSREVGKVVRILQGIKFPNRESFLFLEDQFGKEEFRDNLVSALKISGSSYGRALSGLAARSGAVTACHFPIASGLPVENAKGQILNSLAEDRLSRLGLIHRTATTEGDVIGLHNQPLLSKRRRAAIAVEDVVLGVMKTWMANLGWSSSKALAIRSQNETAKFGQFRFDLVGPCYLSSVLNYKQGKLLNGFVVGDILLDKNVALEDLVPFFGKCDTLLHQKRSTRFQPVFIADFFEADALQELRKRGCLLAMPRTVFGEDASMQLRQLISTVANAAEAVATNPDSVFELIAKVGKLEGAALNLRSIVIEMFVAHLLKLDGFQIDIRQQVVADDGMRAEIDVLATRRPERIFVECKGNSPDTLVDAAEIQDWLDRIVPRIKSWFNGVTSHDEKARFEFYTSTEYTSDAKELIGRIQTTHKKQPINFYCGAEILKKMHDKRETALVKMFREQFTSK